MQYPPKRDRLVTYIASWTHSLKPEDRIHLDPSFVVKHDCITKEAWVSGSLRITKDIDLTAQIIAPFKPELDCLGLKIGTPRWIVPSSFICDIREKDIREQVIRTSLRFNTEFDIVAFINQVAAALNHPPVLTLEKHTIRREVLVKFLSNKRYWMDEAYWLAVSAALPPVEPHCAGMRFDESTTQNAASG